MSKISKQKVRPVFYRLLHFCFLETNQSATVNSKIVVADWFDSAENNEKILEFRCLIFFQEYANTSVLFLVEQNTHISLTDLSWFLTRFDLHIIFDSYLLYLIKSSFYKKLGFFVIHLPRFFIKGFGFEARYKEKSRQIHYEKS